MNPAVRMSALQKLLIGRCFPIWPAGIGNKHCRGCNVSKPRSEFSTHAQASDGLQSSCRACCNRRRREARRG